MPVSKITHDVAISVETFYQPQHSNILMSSHLFAYRITIQNLGKLPVQLLTRHWYIWDSSAALREVEGDGVIGQQPIITSGESYQYVSSCNFDSELGKMWGTYKMRRIPGQDTFSVSIPEFMLIVPFRMN